MLCPKLHQNCAITNWITKWLKKKPVEKIGEINQPIRNISNLPINQSEPKKYSFFMDQKNIGR